MPESSSCSLPRPYILGVLRPLGSCGPVQPRRLQQVNGRLQPVGPRELLFQCFRRGRRQGSEMVVQLGLHLLPPLVKGSPELRTLLYQVETV